MKRSYISVHWIQPPIIFEVHIGQKVNIGQISKIVNFHPIHLKFDEELHIWSLNWTTYYFWGQICFVDFASIVLCMTYSSCSGGRWSTLIVGFSVCVCKARLHNTNQQTNFDETWRTSAICTGSVRVWVSLLSNHPLLCSGRKTAYGIFNTCPTVLNVEKRDFGIKHFEIFRKFYSSRFLI